MRAHANLIPARWHLQLRQEAHGARRDAGVGIGDEVELVIKATIDKGWYIYTVGFDPDCGPIPMSVTLETDASFEVVGDLKAINDKAKYDESFECDVRVFENTGEFRQKIRILSTDLNLRGSYEGQVCEHGRCVQLAGDLTFGAIKVEGKPKTPPKKKQ